MSKPPTHPPRTFLVHSDLFGRQGAVEWTQPRTVDAYVGMRAAEIQHHWVKAVQAVLREKGVALTHLERQAGVPTGRASKLMRGHAHLSLRDLQAIEGVVGPIICGLNYERFEVTDPDLVRRFLGHSE